MSRTISANWRAERSGVARLKCMPAWGATTAKILAVPPAFCIRCRNGQDGRAGHVRGPGIRHAARLAFYPGKQPVPMLTRVFHQPPTRPPCWRCRRCQASQRTTFFPRNCLRSWLFSRMRIVPRPTRGTGLRLTACSGTKRTVQRAFLYGGGPQTIATIRCPS